MLVCLIQIHQRVPSTFDLDRNRISSEKVSNGRLAINRKDSAATILERDTRFISMKAHNHRDFFQVWKQQNVDQGPYVRLVRHEE
jgi:hypothetical protein